MVRSLLVILLGLVGSQQAAPPQAPAPLSKELQTMQGTWIMSNVNGNPVPDGAAEVDFVVTNNTYAQTVNGDVIERGEIKLDTTKKPMVIDLYISEGDAANKVQFGVIQIEPGALKMKLNQPGEPTRPTDFTPVDPYLVCVMTKKAKTD